MFFFAVARMSFGAAPVLCALFFQAALCYRPDTDVEGGGGASLEAQPGDTPVPQPAPTVSPSETESPTPASIVDCTKDDTDPYVTGDFLACCNGPKSGCLGKHGGNRHHYLCQPKCDIGSGSCKTASPAAPLKSEKCGDSEEIRVLSYNLFWWNLFKRRGGKEATRLIKQNAPFDLMGFQECEDINWVLGDSGQKDAMATSMGGHAKCIAYDKEKFKLLEEGKADVGEDRRGKHYYGTRGMHWVRLKQTQGGKTILFANHHGPLPVNSGGKCGGTATAYKMVNKLQEVAKDGDVIILVGDFNADDNSETQKEIGNWMYRLGHHWVDAIFSNCEGGDIKNLGKGGSDHDALMITKKI